MRIMICLGVAVLLAATPGHAGSPKKGCTTGWHVTGYNVPNEAEYDGPRDVELVVDGKKRSFKKGFIHDTDDQYEGSIGAGWGKTIEGDVIGHYGDGGTWISAENALDNVGNPLIADPGNNATAVDPKVLPRGTRFKIPSLPGEWGKRIYVAVDTGTGIKGKHVDVFTGDGKKADDAAYYLTGDDKPNNELCIM